MEDYSFGVIPIFRKVKGSEGYRFLLVKHAQADYWGFPKGHQEIGESDVETALRELAEETGITDCEIHGEIQFVDEYTFELDGKHFFLFSFRSICQSVQSEPKSPDPRFSRE